MEISPEIKKYRKLNYPIHPLLHNRWSPRAMTGEPMTDEELFPLFEAARWAPSSYNNQPWIILYAKRDTPEWDLFYSLMVDFNQKWTKNASALVVMASHNLYELNQKPAPTHSYDTGAAWMSIALEGSARGYVVHGMSGFDYEKARQVLNIPKDYTVEAMAAIGKRAPKEVLPPEIQAKEFPSPRKELAEIICNGKFVAQKKASKS